jgi:squalene-hopene/tetraprenyl-beta-curcumene cyclase
VTDFTTASGAANSRLLLIPRPRGFCAGVVRAIDIVRTAIEQLGAPIYVRKEIVHNRHVVDELSARGAIFVDDVQDVPAGAVVVFSAHGVSPAVRGAAAARRLHVIDATCPLVTKVHLEAVRFAREGYTVVLIGHRDHDEVIGTLGEAADAIQVISSVDEVAAVDAPDPARLAYLTQTTLSVDDTREIVERLRARFPSIVGPADRDICYATQNRQTALKLIASRVQVVLVVGAKNSSNSNRLVEVAARAGTVAHLIESVGDVRSEWLAGCTRIGVTAGASTPDHLVAEVIDHLRACEYGVVEEVTFVDENVRFSLPRELRDDLAGADLRVDPGGVDLAGADLRVGPASEHEADLRVGPSGVDLVGADLRVGPASEHEGRTTIDRAIDRSTAWLLAQQAPDGYWCGELEADTTLESDYILYLHVIGRPERERVRKLAAYIRQRQLPCGGWNIYEGGPAELNATVKAYVALELAGDSPDAPHLVRARGVILELGGLEATNSFTRFYLALIGAVSWNFVPAVPPELLVLPARFPVSIYRMSSWTRAIVVPLTILYALRPRWDLGAAVSIEELFSDRTHAPNGVGSLRASWRNVFLALDCAARAYERLPWTPVRTRALAAARQWLLEHIERSDGLAAIYPAIMNAAFALKAIGYTLRDEPLASQVRALADLEIEDADTLRLQPCRSPVWDTAIAMSALVDAGLPRDHPALVRAASWLLDRQITGPGDWQVQNPETPSGGWAFEFRNDFYPDVDDTAFVLIALRGVAYPDRARMEAALDRGIAWLLSMQNADGGWGAFDRDNDTAILTEMPFADHNAMLDPSTADVTARVLECLAVCGRATDPSVERGLAYLAREQEADGSWYGRWGVNYIYGTSGVLRAAQALGLGSIEMCRRGADWLRSIQNDDGGFGETCASYDDPTQKGIGPSTPSQTAWGLIGLIAAGGADDQAAARALDALVESQRRDGSWNESATTGTGFPRVFYLKYHLYRHSFPLAALGRRREQTAGLTDEAIAEPAAMAGSRGQPCDFP